MSDNATIYTADTSLLGTKFFNLFPEIQSYEGVSEGDTATGLVLTIPQATIRMNFMPGQDVPPHLDGFAGYAKARHEGNRDELIHVLSRIKSMRYVLGCVIEPGFDDDGVVVGFLVNFSARLNGLLFIWDSIIDYDGAVLLGPVMHEQE